MQLPPIEYLQTLPPPNYVNPVTRGNAKIIINIVFYSILICFMGLRVYVRTHLRKFFGTDDTLILIALAPTTVFFIVSILADTSFKWTRHSNDIPRSEVPRGLKIVLCTEVMFAAACTLTKLSMLSFVYRMLASATLLWRRITLAAIGVVSLQGTIFVITTIFQCRPPQDYWKVTVDPQPNCIDQKNALLFAGIVNTLTDFVVVGIPIRTVWSLQLRSKQAVPVMVLFGFGFLSACCGIIRTYYTYKVSISYDAIWDSYPVWVTAALELYIGIICASIPATKPFFCAVFPHVFGGTLAKSAKSANSHPSRYSYANSRSRQITQSRSIRVTSSHEPDHGEELLRLEKGLSPSKGGFSTTTISAGVPRRGSDDSCDVEAHQEDCMRIMQTVDIVNERQWSRGRG